jgi:ribonucleoside-diphosphate reductase alpha chain
MDFTYSVDDPDHIVTKAYHELKPTMQEIFGIEFYNKVKEFFDTQIECHGYNVKNHNSIPDIYLDLLRNPEFCGAYSSFEGSPLSKGQFQFDLWGVSPNTSKYDWESLRQSIIANGVRNSLCIAPMPTASTSQILANNECFEPFTSNIYTRRTLAGEFVVINKHLMKELKDRNLWSVELKNQIIEQKGSIQNITQLPQDIREKYKIVWDISMKRLIDMAKERGAFICQSQSMNLWVEDPNYGNLTKMHFYAWRAGLKTGLYYLRRKAKHQAQQFTIEPKKNMSSSDLASQVKDVEEDNHEVCEMCSG